ncbi:N-acetylglucosamine-specific PTS transporter subunit IIBC [Pelosinus sp. sgz500959]|uniref:N-acetylglucosamine-specific PTS transporter subunit IIBC n=1 Tax=Pelosinus sp. sgz500959 TaxID=3242472 RepID=UPI00366E266A
MSNSMSYVQKLGKALMTPVAVLPAAALMLRLGAPDILAWKWMFEAGDAIFANLALVFAVGIAIGLAKENNGVAGLAALIGYFVLTKVAISFDKTINMGVLAGFFSGIVAGYLYNKYNDIRLPDFLGFFGGRRFVPIITSFYMLIFGVLAGYIWPMLQHGLNAFGNAIATSGSFGALIFGVLNRALIPFGLHHVMNSLVWFQFGTFTTEAGKIVTGDLSRFFAQDPTAGLFMTGFFPIMMFGLPAACLAMITAAKPEKRKSVTGMLLGIALTSFLTGITEPIEFTFLFLAPALYAVHAVLTGLAMFVTASLGIKCGFGFSAGAIDWVLSKGIATKPWELLGVGLVFGAIYYVVFLTVIKKYNLPTPGREEDIGEESVILKGLNQSDLTLRAQDIIEALGGKTNIVNLDACITRLRVAVKDGVLVNEKKLKQLGATGVMKMNNTNYQVVVGTVADPLATQINQAMKL